MMKRLLSSILSVALLIGAAVVFAAPGFDPPTRQNPVIGTNSTQCGEGYQRVVTDRDPWQVTYPDSEGVLKTIWIWAPRVDCVPLPDPTSTPTPVPVPEPVEVTVTAEAVQQFETSRSTRGTNTQPSSSTTQAKSTPPTPTPVPDVDCEGVTHYTFQQVQDGEITNEVWSAYRKGPCFLPASEIEGGP